jgi:peptide/nickel transport system substrate-binding protein
MGFSNEDLALQLKKDLAEIGITINIAKYAAAVQDQRLFETAYEIHQGAFGMYDPTILGTSYLWFGNDTYFAKWNHSWWDEYPEHADAMWQLTLKALAEPDRAKKLQYMDEMNELWAKYSPFVFIMQMNALFATSDRVYDFFTNPWHAGQDWTRIKISRTPQPIATPKPTPTPTPTPTPGPTPTPIPVKNPGVLNVISGTNWDTFDPYHTWMGFPMNIVRHVYDRLFDYIDSSTPTPYLVDTFSWSDDYKEWTFKLKDDVYFHTGEQIDSYSVKWCLDRARYHTLRRWSSIRAILGENFEIEEVDKLTFKITLEEPSIDVPHALCFAWLINPYEVQRHGPAYPDLPPGQFNEWLRENPAGSGPYQLEEFVRQEFATLKRWDDYWDPYGWLDQCPERVKFPVIFEWTTRLAMLGKGDIDLIMSSGNEKYADEMMDVEDLVVDIAGLMTVFYHVQFDVWRPPFDEKIVRQALCYAVPWDDMVTIGTSGYGERCFGYYSSEGQPGYIGAEAAKYTFDIDKAQEMLVQAGFPEGTGLGREIEICTSSFNPALAEMAVMLKETWKELGIESKVVIYSDPILWEKAIDGDLDVIIGGWSGSSYSQYSDLVAIHHTSGIATGWNNQHFSTAEMDDLLDRMKASLDPVERDELLHEAVTLMFEEASLVPMYNIPQVISYQPWVTVERFAPGQPYYYQSVYNDGIFKAQSN